MQRCEFRLHLGLENRNLVASFGQEPFCFNSIRFRFNLRSSPLFLPLLFGLPLHELHFLAFALERGLALGRELRLRLRSFPEPN